MRWIERLKSLFDLEKGDPERLKKEKKECIENLTSQNEFMNERVNSLFDLLDD